MPTLPTQTIPQELRRVIELGRRDPVVFAEELLGMRLHEGQKKYLRRSALRQERTFVLNPANRWGKSVCVSILQLWHDFYKIGIPEGNGPGWWKTEYRTANLAPHSALTEPVFKTIDHIMTGRFAIRLPDGTVRTNTCKIEWFYLKDRTLNSFPYKQFFFNNTYIEHLSLSGGSDNVQGRPYGVITYDEGGRSHHLEAQVSGDIMPRLFDWAGQFHLVSTPDTNSPSILQHYKYYQDGLLGINQTYTQEGSLTDNTFFTPAQIKDQYDLYENDPMREQVLEGKFVFGGDNMFNAQDILDAEDSELNDGKRYEEGHTYAIGTDSAIGSDEMVHSVLDITNLKVTKEGTAVKIEGNAPLVKQIASKGNSKSPQRHLNDFLDLVEAYCGPNRDSFVHMLETWNGESVRFYHELPYWVQARTKCYGSWQPPENVTDNQNKTKNLAKDAKKADILMALGKMLSAKVLKIFKIDPNPPFEGSNLTQQLSIYKEDDTKIPTDRVISLALACWIATHGAPVAQKELQMIDL
jgi:hypothetical protein